jgi:hypothetical protein
MHDDSDPFIEALVGGLSADPRVVGLVLAGSSAETSRRDQWSDHDFLVVTDDGSPEGYRTDLSWLPQGERLPDGDTLAFWFRETPHGLKALYRSGLLLEFAVFDRAEFAACALNHYRVAIDRGGITDLARDVHARTLSATATAARSLPAEPLALLRAFLSLVYLGTGRARRGERLSANVVIRDYATTNLLRLLRAVVLGEDPATAVLDDLDPWRRFERAAPALAGRIDTALALPVDQAGPALLRVADAALRDHWPDYPAADTAIVLDLLTA